MFYLGTNRPTTKLPRRVTSDANGVSIVLGGNYGTYGYFITPKGARFLLSNVFPLEMQLDSWLEQIARGFHPEFIVMGPTSGDLVRSNAADGRDSDIQNFMVVDEEKNDEL